MTVAAISEATIQVLISHGADQLTTTRVAERAGVSVGTLYQYFPNKESLLIAVLQDYVGKVLAAVEVTCQQAQGKPLQEMIQRVVEAVVDAKMERTDISLAFYELLQNVRRGALLNWATQRYRKAVEEMLRTAPDIKSPPDTFAIDMMIAAIGGARDFALEAGASPDVVQKLRKHLVLLCQSYMAAVTAA